MRKYLVYHREAIERMNRLGENGIPFLFIIDYEAKLPVVLPLGEAEEHEIFYDINGKGNFNYNKHKPAAPVELIPKAIDFRYYKPAFDRVIEETKRGNTYLLNLCFETELENKLSLYDIFSVSKAKYKLLFKNNFVLFSPEIFCRIQDGWIRTYPMKGTIDASVPNAKEKILNDPKERAEHATIVDLLRNDLSMIATKVQVERYRYLDKIHTSGKDLYQVSSSIKGRLPDDYKKTLGNILFRMLPAGSVSGAPKEKTTEIIRKVENFERGYFTGIFGYFDGRCLDSGVMIRFIECREDRCYYKSGGGITFQSKVRDEYMEMINKIYVPLS